MKSNLKPLIYLFSCFLCFLVKAQDRNITLLENGNDPLLFGLNELKINDTTATYIKHGETHDYFIDFSNADSLYWNASHINLQLHSRVALPKYIVDNSRVVQKAYIDSLNALRINKVQVLVNGEPLNDVGWKEIPEVVTNDVFESFATVLSPQKRGYWFSPDIFNFDAYESDQPKVFKAYKYDLKEKLQLFLPLRGNLKNTFSLGTVQLNNDMEFVKDSSFGRVAKFNGESSYIDFNAQNDEDYTELTISTWIKPERVNETHSIIGKGQVFSAKIFNKRLLFTTPGIKDHIASTTEIEPDKWTHIAFVYVPNTKVYFYVNGKLAYETNASTIEPTNHSILIGTNLWGQNYEGLMTDLAVWTRALSNEEIRSVFIDGISLKGYSGFNLSFYLFLSVIILLGILVVLVIKKKAKKKIKPVQGTSSTVTSQPGYHINILGGFKVFNQDYEDITHRFSPKRKELFLLLLLYTTKDKGISSKKMAEVLWPSFSAGNAKNNRSTQVKELRNILEGQLEVGISYTDKKWKLVLGPSVSSDVVDLYQYVGNVFSSKKSTVPEENIARIVAIVNQGVLLPNIELEWLDEFKSKYGNAILDVLSPYLEDEKREVLSKTMLFDLVNAVLTIDPLHEEAVKLKIELLVKDGKHMSAKKTAENFHKLYKVFYKEAYTRNLM